MLPFFCLFVFKFRKGGEKEYLPAFVQVQSPNVNQSFFNLKIPRGVFVRLLS